MLYELNKYKQNGHFFLTPGDDLAKVCNAPEKQIGVFMAYALKNGKIELVFIGGTGEVSKRNLAAVQLNGSGGIKDQLINGQEFSAVPRKISWPARIEKEEIEALDIYWYITHNEWHQDCPGKVENKLFEIHFNTFHRMPRWNYEL